MSRSHKSLSSDFWPPRVRPDSYQPPTAYRPSAGIRKHSKKADQRHTGRVETDETGRLSPRTNQDDEEPTSKTMRDEIDYSVQIIAKIEDSLQSLKVKVANMDSKLEQILASLGVETSSHTVTAKSSVRKQRETTRTQQRNTELQDFASPREIAEALRVQRQSRYEKKSPLSRRAQEKGSGQALMVRPVSRSTSEQVAESSELQNMRRSLKVVSRYLGGI